MRRIDSPTSVDGRFVDGDPVNGINPSDLNAKWFNAVQEEIINMIEAGDLTPDEQTNQMSVAIENLITKQSGGAIREGVVSSVRSALSDIPKFIVPNNIDEGIRILATESNPLRLQSRKRIANFTTEQVLSGLTLGPSTGSVKAINEPGLTADANAGSNDYVFGSQKYNSLNIDGSSAEFDKFTNRPLAFKKGNGISKAFLRSTTEMVDVKRNWFFNHENNPINSETFANDDNLTVLALNIIFFDFEENNFFAYSDRIYESATEPATAANGEIWHDLRTGIYRRYEVNQFVEKDYIIVAEVACDETKSLGARCVDGVNTFNNENNLIFDITSGTQISTKFDGMKISVYGSLVTFDSIISTSISDDLKSGVSNNANTQYYVYLNKNGKFFWDTLRPQYRSDLKGYYHPFEAWRAVAEARTDASSALDEDDGHNAYLSHKYNPNLKIDQEFSFESTSDASSIELLVGTKNPFTGITRPHSDGRYTVTLRSGFFANVPRVVALVAQSASIDNIVWNPDIQTTNSFGFTGIRNASSAGVSTRARGTISRGGNDFLQTRISNELK